MPRYSSASVGDRRSVWYTNFQGEGFSAHEVFSPKAEENPKSTEQDLRAIRYLLEAYRTEKTDEDRFLRRTIYTMQANRRLDWKVLLLVCGAGGFVGTVACILLAYLFGVILMEVHV